jgi:hypothetical protein
LILGAVAIATEIKTTDLLPAGQQLSGTTLSCIKTAVDKRETTLISATTSYQNGYILALTSKKTALLAAWDKASKKEIKSALLEATKSHKSTYTSLKKSLKTAQKSAKTNYKMDTKACKSTGIQDLLDIHNEDD